MILRRWWALLGMWVSLIAVFEAGRDACSTPKVMFTPTPPHCFNADMSPKVF